MRRLRTLRVRFAAGTAALLLIALAAFGAFVYVNLYQSLNTAINESLQLSAAQAAAAVNSEDGALTIADSIPDSVGFADLSARGLTIRIIDLDGHILQAVGRYRAAPLDAASLAAVRQNHAALTTRTLAGERDDVRFYVTPIIEQGTTLGVVEVAQSLDTVNDTLHRLLALLLVSIPVLVGTAAIGGYLLAARALAPIDHITQTAQQISAADLHARLALPPTDDEVGRLAATFDGMLERLDDSFQRERRFTADASHELRTPLTAMQTILGVTRERRRTPEAYEAALDDLAHEAQRLRSLIESLLRLARDDAQSELARKPIDLSTLLADVVDSFAPIAEAHQLTLTCAIAPNLWVCGDSDGLVRVLVNLLDNAVKYTPHGSIHVAAAAEDSLVAMHITDTGIGIEPEHLPRLFDRFYRVDAARSTGGTGLGLAIAQEIVRAHNGQISAASTPSHGTTLTVRLPRQADGR